MRILNLGCGSKTSSDSRVINLDWSILLRIRSNPLLRLFASIFLTGDRLSRFKRLPQNILVHDLAKGIPFDSESIDVVYHSHVLEHLDRDVTRPFMREVWRVLKPGGVQRIVVPDLEWICRAYLHDVERCEAHFGNVTEHDHSVAELIEQSVRKQAFGSSKQSRFRRFIENLVLGDARRRGETHQWLYDRFNLAALLIECEFQGPVRHRYDTSQIPNWNSVGLDLGDAGQEWKPQSLYMEAVK